MLTVPTDKQPPTLDHGDMFFFVSQRPGQAVSFEPQFIAGYDFKEGSKVSVTVGDKKFSMFTKGKSAWVENAAEEPLLIAAMKAGSDMKVAGQVRTRQPDQLRLLAEGHFGGAEFDRQLQIGRPRPLVSARAGRSSGPFAFARSGVTQAPPP